MTSQLEIIGTILFGIAVAHTFLANSIRRFGDRFAEGSVLENLFHFLGEVEVVFGLWAALFVVCVWTLASKTEAIIFLENRSFAEPLFVFVIMVVCSTRPILEAAKSCLGLLAALIPGDRTIVRLFILLFVTPLLGSFITEPAAMTVAALILRDEFFSKSQSQVFKYACMAVLFVNISIGGTLTPYAAPPVLMVASTWQWDLNFMLTHFGWRAVLACLINSILMTWFFSRHIKSIKLQRDSSKKVPHWVTFIHLAFLVFLVINHQYEVIVIGAFLFFLGFVEVSQEYQSELQLKPGLLVAFFLGGLVILGKVQGWWLEPLIRDLKAFEMFSGALVLTSITDNAALTYLGAQVPNLSDSLKYALVAGAVVGGGMTVIANAPNPAGYSIFLSTFGRQGIHPLKLALGAVVPTLVAAIVFWI